MSSSTLRRVRVRGRVPKRCKAGAIVPASGHAVASAVASARVDRSHRLVLHRHLERGRDRAETPSRAALAAARGGARSAPGPALARSEGRPCSGVRGARGALGPSAREPRSTAGLDCAARSLDPHSGDRRVASVDDSARSGSSADVLLDGAAAAVGLIGGPAARWLTSALLWIAAAGGTAVIAFDWNAGVPSGWLWTSVPAAWIALVFWRRRRS